MSWFIQRTDLYRDRKEDEYINCLVHAMSRQGSRGRRTSI